MFHIKTKYNLFRLDVLDEKDCTLKSGWLVDNYIGVESGGTVVMSDQ